jgi:hypothetical protein
MLFTYYHTKTKAEEQMRIVKEADTAEAVKRIGKLIEDHVEGAARPEIMPLAKVDQLTAIQVVKKTELAPIKPTEEIKPRKKKPRKAHAKAAHPRKKRTKKK